ncbi:hypothetical protein ABZY44_14845 [Streptomyces sp. NPDC006544]|uniref:LppU/SCO3897 family protein n=1 Tax=Streptomyces sp. NPDC006544 TaxID=3154583 RepID=UPI0033B735FC
MATPPPPQPGAGPQSAGPYGPYAAAQPPPGPGTAPGGPYAPPPSAGPRGQATPAQQGPYGSWSAPQPSYGHLGCRICGARPAAEATVRGHQGMIVLMRFLSLRGPFCRDCGLATYRRMSSDTLWQGWWGPLSLFITPVTVLVNLGPRAAFRRLGPPEGGFRPALDPGRPLRRRPVALLLVAPVLLVVLGVLALIAIGLLAGDDDPLTLSPGQCVRNAGTVRDQKLVVVDCGSPRAEYRVDKLLDGDRPCVPGAYLASPEYGPGGYGLSCLTPLRAR